MEIAVEASRESAAALTHARFDPDRADLVREISFDPELEAMLRDAAH